MTQTMLETWERKSRSGMTVMWGSHLIKDGSAVQSTVAQSSTKAQESECAEGRCEVPRRNIAGSENEER